MAPRSANTPRVTGGAAAVGRVTGGVTKMGPVGDSPRVIGGASTGVTAIYEILTKTAQMRPGWPG